MTILEFLIRKMVQAGQISCRNTKTGETADLVMVTDTSDVGAHARFLFSEGEAIVVSVTFMNNGLVATFARPAPSYWTVTFVPTADAFHIEVTP